MLHKRQPPQIPIQRKAPQSLNDWQRYQETMEHIGRARSTLAGSGKLIGTEAGLYNLLEWAEKEIGKLQQGKKKGA